MMVMWLAAVLCNVPLPTYKQGSVLPFSLAVAIPAALIEPRKRNKGGNRVRMKAPRSVAIASVRSIHRLSCGHPCRQKVVVLASLYRLMEALPAAVQ